MTTAPESPVATAGTVPVVRSAGPDAPRLRRAAGALLSGAVVAVPASTDIESKVARAPEGTLAAATQAAVRKRRTLEAPPLAELTPLAARAIDVVKIYGKGETAVRALDGVTVGFTQGRFTAIMGPSGSGKSTLMHCLAGLDRLTSGRILVGETDLSNLSHKRLTNLRRDRIGFVFQAFNLVPTLTVLENITLPLALAGRKPDRAWLDRVIEAVGLGDRLGHKPAQLSGGQQQRAAIARALATRPDIIFADEPTGNLDSGAGAEMLSFMRNSVREMGQTVVLVTHDPVAACYAERVVFLADGCVVDEMTAPTVQRVIDRVTTAEGDGCSSSP